MIGHMRYPISVIRRKIVALISVCLLPACTLYGKAMQDIHPVPCSFPFDASRKGNVLHVKFRVKEYRPYIFALRFSHEGGEKASQLFELLSTDSALYLSDSLNSGSPVRVISDDFMEKKEFSSQREREAASTKANEKYWAAVHSTYYPNVKKNKYMYVTTPRNIAGIVPISIKISKMDDQGNLTQISDETLDTMGIISGGFVREITSAGLRPGNYEVRVETVRDSPPFFDTPIRFEITYTPKTLPTRE